MGGPTSARAATRTTPSPGSIRPRPATAAVGESAGRSGGDAGGRESLHEVPMSPLITMLMTQIDDDGG